MKPIAWIRPCESEGAVLEWDKPHSSDCADPTPLYHGSEVDARIAELTAEVARYKAALGEIVDPYSYGWSRQVCLDGIDYQDIARNALREGK